MGLTDGMKENRSAPISPSLFSPYPEPGQLPGQGAVGLHEAQTEVNNDILVGALQTTAHNRLLHIIHLSDPLRGFPGRPSLPHRPAPDAGALRALRRTASASSTWRMTARRQKAATVVYSCLATAATLAKSVDET